MCGAGYYVRRRGNSASANSNTKHESARIVQLVNTDDLRRSVTDSILHRPQPRLGLFRQLCCSRSIRRRSVIRLRQC